MSRSDSRRHGSAQNSGKIGARAGFFRSRFDHIEDRSGTAALARVNYFEGDARNGIVFKDNAAQLGRIDDEIGCREPRGCAECHVCNRVIGQGQLHGAPVESAMISRIL